MAPGTNPLEMSDEDFSKLNGPPAEAAASDDDAAAATGSDGDGAGGEALTDAERQAAGSDDDDDDSNNAAAGDAGDDNADAGGDSDDDDQQTAADVAAAGSGGAAGTQGDKGGQAPAGDKPADVTKDGKPAGAAGEAAAGDGASDPGQPRVFQVPTSFKANGKTVELKDEKEALGLMQMGANYTRKMQELQPHRKSLMMLQANNIDEAKLSYLIDLDQKNPEAIKKLIKDSGIDPLDIDTSVEPAYEAGGHELTDDEVSFRSALEDMRQTPEGQQTIIEVNSRFDEQSKDALWAKPEILSVLHSQRQSGVYSLITEEMERQITLGKIPPNTPFLEAYKIAGDELTAQVAAAGSSGQGPGADSGQAGKPAPVVVGTRAATPRSKVANGDAASAAASSRSTTGVKAPVVNPLAMSDDDFLKQMGNRV